MKRDAIDLSTLNVFTLFRKYFVPTLLGMLSMSAVTAIDGIFVGHGVGSDGIAAVNICVPLLMLFTGIGLMVGAGCSVVASIQLSRGKSKSARLNCAYNHSNGVSRACGFPCGILVTSGVSVLLPYWERQRLLCLCSSGTRYLCPIWGTMA